MFDSPAKGPVAPMVDMRPLAGFHDYASAQRTVDALSDAGFPVETTAIVGSDLRLEERVTGRLTSGRAALHGLESGAVIGLVIGLFLGLFTATTISFIGIVIWSVIWAAIVGAVFGFVAHALSRGARDFSSRSSIVAGRYDVLVAAHMFEQARAVLATSGAGTPAGPGQGGGATQGGPGAMYVPSDAVQDGGVQAPSGQDRMGMPGGPSMERPDSQRNRPQ
jgi:uncharacterized membrane protein (Fun14 family)